MCNGHSLASPCGKSGSGPEVALISFVEVAGFAGAGVGADSDSTGIFSSECAMMGTVATGLATSGAVVLAAGGVGTAGVVDCGEVDKGETFSWFASLLLAHMIDGIERIDCVFT